VTWDQWEACVQDGACDGIAVENALRLDREGKPDSNFKDWGRGTRPVVGVSWYDAKAFVGWLNKKTGSDDTYKLLSEAEWEYAARGGTTTAFPWGDKLDHNYGNFGIPGPGLGGKAEGRDVWLEETSPVASFPPNAFGLHDMHGNCFEWVEDCYLADLTNSPADGSANKQGSCNSRMFRSGSFISNPMMHRSGNRVRGYVPTTRGRNYLTIRVAKTLP
jgi:formylglycine-generating enzyme required for sulfatase activity